MLGVSGGDELCIRERLDYALQVRGRIHGHGRVDVHGVRGGDLQGCDEVRGLHSMPFAHELCIGEC